MQVGRVEDQGVVTEGDDEPAGFGRAGSVRGEAAPCWGETGGHAPEQRTEQRHAEGVAAPQDDQDGVLLLTLPQSLVHLRSQPIVARASVIQEVTGASWSTLPLE